LSVAVQALTMAKLIIETSRKQKTFFIVLPSQKLTILTVLVDFRFYSTTQELYYMKDILYTFYDSDQKNNSNGKKSQTLIRPMVVKYKDIH